MRKLHPRGDVKKVSLTSGWIVGLDEVGAGSLAGPLCVGAFAFPVERIKEIKLLERVFDSKQLPPEKREAAAAMLKNLPHCFFQLLWIEVPEIETINIFWARMKAFWTLILGLEQKFANENLGSAFYLVDGPRLNRKNAVTPSCDEFVMMDLERRILAQSKADSIYFAVAAASILAKVERDRFMTELDRRDFATNYSWATNKGYATPDHIAAIVKHGMCVHHRRSFCGNILSGNPDVKICETSEHFLEEESKIQSILRP